MKKYKMSSIKISLLSGVMALTLLGVTGCGSEKQSENNNGNNITEAPSNEEPSYLSGATMMSKEEVMEAMENGEDVQRGKDIDNSILDEVNADRAYRYYTEIYDDENYTHLIDTDKDTLLLYPTLLNENDPRLKWKDGKHYSKLVFNGDIQLLKIIEYKEKDGSWYKWNALFSNNEHLGNKVTNPKKLKELNGAVASNTIETDLQFASKK